MKRLRTDNKKEIIVYIILWAILFISPILSIYIRTVQIDGASFAWNELIEVWKQMFLFLVVFLLHNSFLAPLLITKKRKGIYFTCLAVLVSLFVLVQCSNHPGPQDRHHHFAKDRMEHRDVRPEDADHFEFHKDFRPHHPIHKEEFDKPPIAFLGQHDIIATIILLLMLGVNLGIKLYFRQVQDRARMVMLERENLEQQLEYLKYQINPHFLMNTLNNIHALVDIDPEQAKETIVQLSKIMRFVLYEGSKQKVPLRQELVFLQNYIELMQMRVSDQVTISVSMPDIIPESAIPPLMLITFVENAFKHGVSYQHKSFIDIAITIEKKVFQFHCKNSRLPQNEDKHGGVGLANVKKRLELIYGSSYKLNIDEQPDTYCVDLSIPL